MGKSFLWCFVFFNRLKQFCIPFVWIHPLAILIILINPYKINNNLNNNTVLAKGPISVLESIGSPRINFSSLAFNADLNSSYFSSTMMYLFAEKQTYPALLALLLIAHSTARLISASFRIMKGSFPPNSITHFFKYLPESDAICLPAAVDPVNVTP